MNVMGNYKNSVALIHTCNNNVLGYHMVYTSQYASSNPHQFAYQGYPCLEFSVTETDAGDVVVTTYEALPRSRAKMIHRLQFHGVVEIEILTDHEH